MPKCDFNKVAFLHYWNRTSAWVFCSKFAVYFQKTFSSEQLWRAAFERVSNYWQIPGEESVKYSKFVSKIDPKSALFSSAKSVVTPLVAVN